MLGRQCRDGSVNDGGFASDDTGWYCGRHAAYTLARIMAARLWADEIGLDAEALDAACARALAFLRRRQAQDGGLDLNGAYSPNEVGFAITGLATAWERFAAEGIVPCPDFSDELLGFCVRGGEAVLAGSPFTANHRWAAVCAPLAALHRIRPDARYRERVENLLAQGIDVNADGCWEYERSPNYNNVASQGLLVMADALGRDDLLEPLVSHGSFLLHSLQPNGEMDSTISHRQDRAKPGCMPASIGVARRLALITGDGRFTTLAERALLLYPQPEYELVPLPLQLDAFPGPLPVAAPLPDRYEASFAVTGQARWRAPRTLVSFAADAGGHFFDSVRDQWGGARRSDDWFHLHHGGVVVESLTLAGACMQNLQPGVLRRLGPGRYRLEAEQRGWEHTLNFAPGWPRLPIRWDWSTGIDAVTSDKGLILSLTSHAAISLAASLRWHVRPGVTLDQAGETSRVLSAGERVDLKGGSPVTLTAADGSAVVIDGLPWAAHRLPVDHPSAISSVIASHCATLSLGLLFPVSLELRIRFLN